MSDYRVAGLLKELRKNHNYSIQKVASLLGVSKSSVSKWENAEDISIKHLYQLSKLYSVHFSELYNGKLNDEKNADYWKRNYDLNNFDLVEDINNKNDEKIKEFFDRCKNICDRFYVLLPYWAKDELTGNNLDEFNYIKKYFLFDSSYYTYIKDRLGYITYLDEVIEKKFVNETLKSIKKQNKKSYSWEIRKLYNFDYDIKINEICKSENLKDLEYIFSFFSQIEKDKFLYVNLIIVEEKEEYIFGHKQKSKNSKKRTADEIERIPFLKVIINSGANVLYEYKNNTSYWDREMLEYVEGNLEKDNSDIYNKYQFHDFYGKTIVPIFENWKLFSYEEYKEFINVSETEKLKDIVNLKDSKPLQYYKKMIARTKIINNK